MRPALDRALDLLVLGMLALVPALVLVSIIIVLLKELWQCQL